MENTQTKQKEKNKEPKQKLKLIGNIIFYIVLGILFLLACLSMTTRITKGKIGNSQYLVVISGSMDGEKQEQYDIKTIPIKSLIKVDLIQEGKENDFYSSLKKGDVLSFNYLSLNNATITHRIINDPIKDDKGVYKYILQGDAVENDTQTLYSDGRTGEILGKVTSVNVPLGYFYSFISSKVGTVVLVILPCSAVCIFEIVKIIYVVSEEKNKKKQAVQKAETDKKDKEIEELKRQLEEAKKKEN